MVFVSVAILTFAVGCIRYYQVREGLQLAIPPMVNPYCSCKANPLLHPLKRLTARNPYD